MNTEDQIPQSLTITQPDAQLLDIQAQHFLDAARGLEVTNNAQQVDAAKYLTENKAEQNRIDAERREMVDPLNAVVKKINAKYKPIMDTLKEAEAIVKRAIGGFQRLEQIRLQKEQAEANERARKERERLEARAEKAAEKGQEEKADALLNQAASTVATIPAAQDSKVAGLSSRKVWKIEVTDPKAVCRLIAEGLLPPTIIDFKQGELNKIASTWQNQREFDGLRIYQDYSVASRRT